MVFPRIAIGWLFTARIVVLSLLSISFTIRSQDLMPSAAQGGYQASQNSQGGTDVSAPGAGNYSFSPDYRISGLESPASMDNSIDENTYYVGGGDIFRIYASDMPSINYSGAVNENGDLYLQSIGIISLGKITLGKAKQVIANSIKAKLKKQIDIHVSLLKVKSATISISGSVASPGTYTLPGSLRLWDALKLANKEREQPATSLYLNDYNLRSVAVGHLGSDSLTNCDLLVYLLKGDFSQNPYLYPGDFIRILPATDRVYIGGGIKGVLFGLVPIHQNERVTDFFSFFSFDPNADSEHILIQRMDESRNYQITTINISAKESRDFLLKNNDIITVPYVKDFSEIFIVTVLGEVNHPGVYPISKRKTTVQEVLTLAGDYTPFANVEKAAVIRRTKIPSTLFTHGSGQEVNEPLAAMRPELSSGLAMMTATKDYTVILIKDHPETILEPGDQLVIPRAEHMIYVSGSVDRPGAYAFVPHKKIGYYVDLAGGMTSRANRDNITIAEVYGDVFQASTRKVVEDGDIIVVPMAQQYRFLTIILLPLASIFISIATLAISLK
jgi:protein involved in polysaccharide export with SLBB domain